MVLACYREVELDRQHPFAASLVEWNRDHLAMRISLNRLTAEQVGRLLSSLFGQEGVSQDFTQAIYKDTEGNPFFIEEVIKSLIEQGQIYRVEGHWERKEISELAIPQSVKEAIGRRLDRQSQTCMDMLHTAAALGKRFSFSELAASSSTGEEALLDALDEASHAQLIRLESGEVYLFTHDKIREVLYEELNPIRKRRLHLRIGEGLEKLYGLNACEPGCMDPRLCHCDVQALAHHFIEAGELEKGLRYAVQAAEKAEQVFALPEAVEYYQRAIECAEALDRKDELLRLYEALGWVHYQHGAFQLSIEAFEHIAGAGRFAAAQRPGQVEPGAGLRPDRRRAWTGVIGSGDPGAGPANRSIGAGAGQLAAGSFPPPARRMEPGGRIPGTRPPAG